MIYKVFYSKVESNFLIIVVLKMSYFCIRCDFEEWKTSPSPPQQQQQQHHHLQESSFFKLGFEPEREGEQCRDIYLWLERDPN